MLHQIRALRLTRRLRIAAAALAVLLLTVGLYGLHSARQSHASGSADIALTLTPMPNVGVTSGSIISYQLRVRNLSSSSADRVLVHLPYDPTQLRVLDAAFTDPADWVTGVQGDYMMLMFGKVGGHSERTATVRMYVLDGLPVDTVINMWAGYGWDDDNGGGEGYSANAAPVVVEATDISSGAVWMSVDPAAGQTGTLFSFFSDRFAPGEQVTASLNAPYGPQPLNISATADDQGRVWLVFDSAGFPPGEYELVARSERTLLVASAPFTIE
jgi:hypothetical protein